MGYGVIYADPPWAYRSRHTGGSMKSGAADKYPVLSPEEIASLPVSQIASPDSVLFLWSTVPLLPDALGVLKAWGFSYKTMITWHKTGRLGLGYWFRGECEHLLVGIRGKVRPFRCQLPNFVEAPAMKHSEKPPLFRQIVEQSTVNVPGKRLELFGVQLVDGWDAIGLKLDGRDIRDSLASLILRDLEEGMRDNRERGERTADGELLGRQAGSLAQGNPTAAHGWTCGHL